MKRLHTDERGIAAVEAALGMLILVPLLLIAIEASRALMEYSQLQNATMEGARMLSRQNGDTSGVASYINSLFSNADGTSTVEGSAPTVAIGPRDANNNVTVQVDHVFKPFLSQQSSGSGIFGLLGSNAFTLSSTTVVALPAAN